MVQQSPVCEQRQLLCRKAWAVHHTTGKQELLAGQTLPPPEVLQGQPTIKAYLCLHVCKEKDFMC